MADEEKVDEKLTVNAKLVRCKGNKYVFLVGEDSSIDYTFPKDCKKPCWTYHGLTLFRVLSDYIETHENFHDYEINLKNVAYDRSDGKCVNEFYIASMK